MAPISNRTSPTWVVLSEALAELVREASEAAWEEGRAAPAGSENPYAAT